MGNLSWHYQAMRHVEEDGEVWFAVHEYFHTSTGSSWTKDPVDVEGDTVEDLRWTLKTMLSDLDKYDVEDWDDKGDI
jgi:hypothetical protein